MKHIPVLLLVFFSSGTFYAQKLEGSWKLTHKNGTEINNVEYIRIYQDGYFAFGGKKTDNNEFTDTGGGEYLLEEDEYTEIPDFYTTDPEKIGKKQTYSLAATDKQIVLKQANGGTETWTRLSGQKDDLTGNWVITGRANTEGEVREMTPGDRRTIKILSGGRFQWVAFNSGTKEFHGTGGGTYTAEDGKYTEQITFFSRDNSRVGASLEFNYEVKDGKWHHSGKSSAGKPIYEIWSRYEEAYVPKE
ncbi:hypothetical protein ED312_14710 [Sinomicrobium pectinilyticum]|uniref:Membrane or secreted protein n=1 Tax=Sinomicrobium pectinilyticum TaxID=1084421 RepID=A0A3N0E7A5_SINP1|nr:hypothetical protein [Sinomicrobium pectinilyticum]RNL83728.1 hypothetical protein ED312_14710 [Sinomicrobium pectinilyticum]